MAYDTLSIAKFVETAHPEIIIDRADSKTVLSETNKPTALAVNEISKTGMRLHVAIFVLNNNGKAEMADYCIYPCTMDLAKVI
jgi:hypothetical protein